MDILTQLGQWALPIALGVAGWQVAKRLRVPSPVVLGSMLVVGTASILGFVHMSFPVWARLGLQMIIGTYAGFRFNREAARQMSRMGLPVIGVTLWTVSSALAIGFLLAHFTGLDLATALLGTAPGSLPEMSAMALTLNANVAMVATISSTRLLSAMIAMPFLARRSGAGARDNAAELVPEDEVVTAPAPIRRANGRFRWMLSLALGIAGGTLFYVLSIPAAGIMGALLTVAAAQIAGAELGQPPASLRTAAQLGIGTIIGTTFNEQILGVLSSSAVAVILAAAATVASGLVLSRALRRTLGCDEQTALLACSPAGLTQMAVLSEELGAQTFIVSLFQLTRLTAVVVVLPFIFRALLQ